MSLHEYPLLSIHQIKQSPSIRDGVAPDVEENQRVYGCHLIQHAGVLLKLPQVCMVRAQVLFHRFYMAVSMKQYDVIVTAITCLFIATKLEECQRKLNDIINVFYRIFQREMNLISSIPFEIYSIKDKICENETALLRELGFVLHVDPPHKYILVYLNILDGSNELAQLSWNYLNDRFASFYEINLQV